MRKGNISSAELADIRARNKAIGEIVGGLVGGILLATPLLLWAFSK